MVVSVASRDTLSRGGVRVPGGLRRLQSGWDERSSSGGFDSRPPPPTRLRDGSVYCVGLPDPRAVRVSGKGICAREVPERIRESEIVQDRLVLVAGTRLPAWVDPIAPPGVRQLAQLRDADCRTGSSRTEPATNVLFRPEEVHRASSEDDVVPPSNRWDHTMEQQAFIVWPLIAHVDRDRLTAVGARRFDAAIDM